MAIIKMVNVKAGKPYGLKSVLDYITQMSKTENRTLVSGKDCLTETAYREMLLTKQSFHKLTGRQYIHMIQSFPKEEEVTPELVHKLGKQLLEQFPDFQGVVATHVDRRHLHNHLVLNSVNSLTGKKWQFSKEQLYRLREYSDQLCLENGLTVLAKDPSKKGYGEREKGSWKEYLAFTVAESLKVCLTPEEMHHYFQSRGLEVEFRKSDILFTMPDGKKCRNTKLMCYGDFSTENIKHHIQFNNAYIRQAMRHTDYLSVAFKEILSLFEDRSHEEMMRDYFDGRTPALEGHALIEWILKKKNGASFEYGTWKKQPQENGSSNILNTVGELFQICMRAEQNARQKREETPYDEEAYEWEME